ncbi:MAG: shikimate dehydrogenase [Planctomycetes bacterium]|nr:shikimate dehydrogenase [Planctomycetota bacterium]
MSAESPAKICVVIGRTRHKIMQVEIHEAAKRGARLMELRLDFLAKPPDFKRLLAKKPCPLIATVRRPSDGGRYKGSEDDRLTLLRQAIVGGFDWVDIETDVIKQIPRYRDVKRIVSYHNLREVPDDLEKIHAAMCNQDADLVKLAMAAQQPEDNLRVLELVRKSHKPTVAFCMGDMGFPSRILSVQLGAPYTYAAFNKERGIAPGLPSHDELSKVYNVDHLDRDTKVYGVIGDPVSHSLSPLIHNRCFKELGINAIYLPFRVPRGDLPGFMKAFDAVPVHGYSVTIPHKEGAAELPGQKDQLVTLIHAANTLVRGSHGWRSFNTDAAAAVESLKAHLPRTDGQVTMLSSRSILILGAGGVARAVAHALHREGANLILANRTHDRAQKLAEELNCRAVDWNARHNVLSDTVINCTSVGMFPNMDESPLHGSYLKPGLLVFDTIYTPENTLLIKEARDRGCHVLTGVDMFVRQAAMQFKLFTGVEPPLELMHTTIRRALSPVAIRDET